MRTQSRIFSSWWLTKRKVANALMWGGTVAATLLALLPLFLVVYYLLAQGLPALNLAFFTNLPKPVGETGGGMANAIVGTVILIGIAGVIGIPIGLFGGIFLAEFGNNRLGGFMRFCADVLASVPSIVIGILVYSIIVMPMKHFSALSGGIALGIMMIPMVMRNTEEMIRMVPRSQREASLALGATHFTTLFRIVMLSAKGGVITGILLAVARVAGETAPLLFTAFGNRFWSTNLDQPIASLPVQIFTYAIAPYDDWHAQAWAGALVLVFLIFLISVAARYATKGRIHIVR
ncbi:MAG TPA: phosphate ABC transporter permease PstA [Armatimonadota bacterium]|nr:phosphate ABC transporter permease PstA [Armatimonadota bacterium]